MAGDDILYVGDHSAPCAAALLLQCMAQQKAFPLIKHSSCVQQNLLMLCTASGTATPGYPDARFALVAVYTDAALAKINFRWRTALIVRASF